MCIFLASCAGNTRAGRNSDDIIYVSPNALEWSQFSKEDLNRPLINFMGEDIFTEKTMRAIYDSNEKLVE